MGVLESVSAGRANPTEDGRGRDDVPRAWVSAIFLRFQ